MTIDLTGTVIDILPEEKINETLSKRKIVLETKEAAGEKYYINHFMVEFVNRNVCLTDNISLGQEVSLVCSLRGKKTSKGSIFVSIEAFKKVR